MDTALPPHTTRFIPPTLTHTHTFTMSNFPTRTPMVMATILCLSVALFSAKQVAADPALVSASFAPDFGTLPIPGPVPNAFRGLLDISATFTGVPVNSFIEFVFRDASDGSRVISNPTATCVGSEVSCDVNFSLPMAGVLAMEVPNYIRGDSSPLPFGIYNVTAIVYTPGPTYTVGRVDLVDTNLPSVTVDPHGRDINSIFTSVTAVRNSQLNYGIDFVLCETDCDYTDLDTTMLVELRSATDVFGFRWISSEGPRLKMRNVWNGIPVSPNMAYLPPGTYNVTVYPYDGDWDVLLKLEFGPFDIGYDAPDASGSARIGLISPGMSFGGPDAFMPFSAHFPLTAQPDSVHLLFTSLTRTVWDEMTETYNPESFITRLNDVGGRSTNSRGVILSEGSSSLVEWYVGDHIGEGAVQASRIPFGSYDVTVSYTSAFGEPTLPHVIHNITHWPTAPTTTFDPVWGSQTPVLVSDAFDANAVTVTNTHIIRVNTTHAAVERIDSIINDPFQAHSLGMTFVRPHVSFVLPYIVVQDTEDYDIIHVYHFDEVSGVVSAVVDPISGAPDSDLWTDRLTLHMTTQERVTFVRVDEKMCAFHRVGYTCLASTNASRFVDSWATPAAIHVAAWIIADVSAPGNSTTAMIIHISTVRVFESSRYVYMSLIEDVGDSFTAGRTCVVDFEMEPEAVTQCITRSQMEGTIDVTSDRHGRVLAGFYGTQPNAYVIRSYAANLTGDPIVVAHIDELSDGYPHSLGTPRIIDISTHPVTGNIIISAYNGAIFELTGGSVAFFRYPNVNSWDPTSVTRTYQTPNRMVRFTTEYVFEYLMSGVLMLNTINGYSVHRYRPPALPLFFGDAIEAPITADLLRVTYAFYENPTPGSVTLRVERVETGEIAYLPLSDDVVVDSDIESILDAIVGSAGPQGASDARHGFQVLSSNQLHRTHHKAKMHIQSGELPYGIITTPGLFSFEIVYVSFFSNTTVRSVLATNVTLTYSPECNNIGVYLRQVCYCGPGAIGTTCQYLACNEVGGIACGSHGTCNTQSGFCTCASGWSGLTCGVSACNPTCVHGVCGAGPACECESGWSGDACATPVCTGGCGLHGTCTAPNSCDCDDGYTGAQCDQSVGCDGCSGGPIDTPCGGPCGNNQVCDTETDECVCTPEWSGVSCATPVCVGGCSGNGVCIAPDVCECNAGWQGATCTTTTCMCGSHGLCANATEPNLCTCATVANTTRFGAYCNETLSACSLANCEPGVRVCNGTAHGVVECIPLELVDGEDADDSDPLLSTWGWVFVGLGIAAAAVVVIATALWIMSLPPPGSQRLPTSE